MTRLPALLLFCLLHFGGGAQTCTTPGQTPATAFPVCGTSTFQQTNVPICGGRPLYVRGCTGADYADKNPFWYKFTCFQAGSLGFLIRPNNAGDDYDWQLYDITGRNPEDVFTDTTLVVIGNWSGTVGNTGAASTGVWFTQCASAPNENRNPFSIMPQLIQGHTYLLLVSHYTDSQSGYSLSFGGGTAVITDTTPPALLRADAGCNGALVRLRLNKKIRCASLAADGSDFSISPGLPAITGAQGIGCAGGGFDTDSVEITLAAPLPQGSYRLGVRNGTDGNTLLDICNNPLTTADSLSFTVFPQEPTPFDSLARPGCAPKTLRLVFRRPIRCSSVEPGGTDFRITGTYPVTVTAATTTCAGGITREILLTLSGPLQTAGSFSLLLQRGTDGNTLLDECALETPPGASIPFSVVDTVDAAFSFEKRYGCTEDTVRFTHPGNGVTQWQWSLDEGQSSPLQNPVARYRQFTTKNISLIVSNGVCRDTASQTIALTNGLKADFTSFEDNCPNEPVLFTSSAEGIRLSHQWTFGDGGTSTLPNPTHTYTTPNGTQAFPVRYTVTDSIGCSLSVQKTIRVYSSCLIAVPNAFTPDGDGKNDFLRVLNAIKAEKLDFRIFNRWGQLLFQTRDWKRGWDGRVNGERQPTGTYVWILSYTDRDSGQPRQQKGVATLIR
jgi:gliding motility-associated-like protein